MGKVQPCSTPTVFRLVKLLLMWCVVASASRLIHAQGDVTLTTIGSDSQPFQALSFSRNGAFLLGYTSSAPDGPRSAFVWHAGTLHPVGEPDTLILGIQRPGPLIADDGTVVGWGHDNEVGDEQQVWRDAPSDSYQLALSSLPDISAPTPEQPYPVAISADASTILGLVSIDLGVSSAVVWHAPFTEAPDVFGGLGLDPQFSANDLSATGAVIVGHTTNAAINLGRRRAFRTLCTREGRRHLQYLEPIASAESHTGTSVSPDGTAVAGFSVGATHTPQSWLLHDGVTTPLPFDVNLADYLGLSTTGQVVVGRRRTTEGSGVLGSPEAIVWTQAAGARSVQDILGDAGIEVSAAQLQRAVGISGDGQHIAGYGTSEAGKEISWIVDLGQPSDTDGDDEGVCNILDGDFDIDGDVDGIDLMTWQQGYGLIGGATFAEGDADADGNVDGNDFLIWQRNVNSHPEPSSFVPEPSSIALITLGLFGVAFANSRTRLSGRRLPSRTVEKHPRI